MEQRAASFHLSSERFLLIVYRVCHFILGVPPYRSPWAAQYCHWLDCASRPPTSISSTRFVPMRTIVTWSQYQFLFIVLLSLKTFDFIYQFYVHINAMPIVPFSSSLHDKMFDVLNYRSITKRFALLLGLQYNTI